MPKRSSKLPRDVNQRAKAIVDLATNETAPEENQAIEQQSEIAPGKNPAAVALGRLGGLKGGKARAASLSKEERSEIARKAANKRWKKKQSEPTSET